MMKSICLTLGEIPVFDWRGPEFLGFYAIAFATALVWSLARRARAMRALDMRRPCEVSLEDPYEIAFLAGGANRCGQLAVSRLLENGALAWREAGTFRCGGLIAGRKSAPSLNEIETRLIRGVSSWPGGAMPLDKVVPAISPGLCGIASRLAAMGLRPTTSELVASGWSAAIPLLTLMGIGVVKLVIGLSRGKPVLFLVIALIVTLFVILWIASGQKRLTPTGGRTLLSLRNRHATDSVGMTDLAAMSAGVALFGPAALAGYPELIPGGTSLRKELSHLGAPTGGDTTGGCSSGCSGGGGGGCGGGCGGCGGD